MLKILFCIIVIINSVSISSAIEKKVVAELIPNCRATQGGVATATPDGKIYYCVKRMANIEWKYPGAVDYFILHEYGHIFLQSGNEMEIDCWTANELVLINDKKSIKSLKAALKFIKAFKLFDPKYGGTGEQRALLIEKCMEHGPDYYKKN
ncbi:MAG TPA: hypothetical protein EYQ51_08605 [Alphaproteobacteria bacterium]|nr:hypothetical protein [Alphaproteobacteria bacterium]